MLKKRITKTLALMCAVAVLITTLITGTISANAKSGCPFGDWTVVCDFDDVTNTGLGFSGVVNEVGIDYSYNLTSGLSCGEGKVLKWNRKEGVTGNPEVQISFNKVTESNYNALSFWFKNSSDQAQKILVGLRDNTNADKKEFYQLKYSAQAYGLNTADSAVTTLKISASSLEIPASFEGWIQIPFDSFTIHTGYPIDNSVFDVTGFYQLQLWYNDASQSGPYYLDNIGLIKTAVSDFEAVADNSAPHYVPVIDNDTFKCNTYMNNGTYSIEENISPYGNALKWTAGSEAGKHTQISCYFTARSDTVGTQALVFWVSAPAAQNFCVAVVDSKNTSLQECWYLNGSNYPYYMVDADGNLTEKATEKGAINVEAGFSGWVAIPFTSLLQNSGWHNDNGVLDVEYVNQFQMWHGTFGAVAYIDEVGFTENINNFASALGDTRKADFVFTNDITLGSLSVNNAETALSNASPYGNSISWTSDDENESAIKVTFSTSEKRAKAEAVAVWLSCETELNLSVGLAGEGISYTMNGTHPVYFMHSTHTSAAFMSDKCITIPAGFKGWLIMPIENFNSHNTEVLTAAVTEIKLSAKSESGFVCVVDEFAFLNTKKEFAESMGSVAFSSQKTKPNTVLAQGFDDINSQNSGENSAEFDLRQGNSPYGLSMMWQVGYSEVGNKDFYVRFPYIEAAAQSEGICFWVETGTDVNAADAQFSLFIYDYANVTGAGTECWYPKSSQQAFYFIDDASGTVSHRFTSGHNIVLDPGAKGWVYIPFEALEMHQTSYNYDNGVVDADKVNRILIRNSLTSQIVTIYFDEFGFINNADAFFKDVGTDVNLLENNHILNSFGNAESIVNENQNATVTVNTENGNATVSNINGEAKVLINNTYSYTDKLDKVSAVALGVDSADNAVLTFALKMGESEYIFGNDELSMSYVTLCNTETNETVSKPVTNGTVTLPSGFSGYVIMPLWAFEPKQEFTAEVFAGVTALRVGITSNSNVELASFTAVDSTSDYISLELGCNKDTDYLFKNSTDITISGKTVTVNATMPSNELLDAFAVRRGARVTFEDANGVRIYGYSESVRSLSKIYVYVAGTVVASYDIVYDTANVTDNTNVSFFISTENQISINTSRVKAQIKTSSGSFLTLSLNLRNLSNYYLLDSDFNCTQIEVTDKTMVIPENFFGWVIIPYNQVKDSISVVLGLESFNGARLIYDNGEVLFTDCSAYSNISSTVNGAKLDMNANLGDVDGDGFAGVKDCIYIKKYLLDIVYVGNTCICDTNKDSTIDIRDIIRLKQYIA